MAYRGRYWYAYNGTGNMHVSTSYNLLPLGPCECIGSARICAIYAYSRFRSATPPFLSLYINNYITAAQLGSSNAYPILSPVVFVYKITLMG